MIPWFRDNPRRDINLHVYECYSKVKTSYKNFLQECFTRTIYKNDNKCNKYFLIYLLLCLQICWLLCFFTSSCDRVRERLTRGRVVWPFPCLVDCHFLFCQYTIAFHCMKSPSVTGWSKLF